jgi:predicted ribosomally synthesized peptide with SipW-like signal peptide
MKKNTKRALVATLLVMILSLTVLVGSTFAYFNDNAIINGSVTTGELNTTLSYAFAEDFDGIGNGEGLVAWQAVTEDDVNVNTNTEVINIKATNYKPGDYTNLWIKFENTGSLDYTLDFILRAKNVDYVQTEANGTLDTNTSDLLSQFAYKFTSYTADPVADITDLTQDGGANDGSRFDAAIPTTLTQVATFKVTENGAGTDAEVVIAPTEVVYVCFQIRMDYDEDDGAQNIYQFDQAEFQIEIQAKQVAGTYVPYTNA